MVCPESLYDSTFTPASSIANIRRIWSENEVVSQVRLTRESLACETKNEVIYVHKSLFLPGQYKDIHTSIFWCLSWKKLVKIVKNSNFTIQLIPQYRQVTILWWCAYIICICVDLVERVFWGQGAANCTTNGSPCLTSILSSAAAAASDLSVTWREREGAWSRVNSFNY